jgi:hypothetical protein
VGFLTGGSYVNGHGFGFGDATTLQLSAEGLGEALPLSKLDGDAFGAILAMSLKELLGGTETA